MTGWPRGRASNGGIDRIPLPHQSGALWLAGKHAVGPDPEAARRATGADVIVCLTERHELSERYPAYVDWLRANTAQAAVWFPIPDLHAPPLAVVLPLLDQLRTRLDEGQSLLIHCAAGFGRAGTIAACLLVQLGMKDDQALAVIAAARPMAGPEIGPQRELVAAVGRHGAPRV